MKRGDDDRLRDIIQACDSAKRAEDVLEEAQASVNDVLAAVAFDAISYNLVVIGEAVKALPPTTTGLRADVPWSEIAKMRDFLTHHYFKVDVAVVRAALDQPLADLAEACRELLGSSPE